MHCLEGTMAGARHLWIVGGVSAIHCGPCMYTHTKPFTVTLIHFAHTLQSYSVHTLRHTCRLMRLQNPVLAESVWKPREISSVVPFSKMILVGLSPPSSSSCTHGPLSSSAVLMFGALQSTFVLCSPFAQCPPFVLCATGGEPGVVPLAQFVWIGPEQLWPPPTCHSTHFLSPGE